MTFSFFMGFLSLSSAFLSFVTASDPSAYEIIDSGRFINIQSSLSPTGFPTLVVNDERGDFGFETRKGDWLEQEIGSIISGMAINGRNSDKKPCASIFLSGVCERIYGHYHGQESFSGLIDTILRRLTSSGGEDLTASLEYIVCLYTAEFEDRFSQQHSKRASCSMSEFESEKALEEESSTPEKTIEPLTLSLKDILACKQRDFLSLEYLLDCPEYDIKRLQLAQLALISLTKNYGPLSFKEGLLELTRNFQEQANQGEIDFAKDEFPNTLRFLKTLAKS